MMVAPRKQSPFVLITSGRLGFFFHQKRKAPFSLDRRWKPSHKGVLCLFGWAETSREAGARSWMCSKVKDAV
ncbi:hypothetical protein HMPREF9372_0379 [Sporosarcina newyorkensis 2681]|uniref:Uncharacterized protein n=1 Tax=Sporosarcina newyorkensis 2681 TaxID=1027292 RepID=F9DNJ9_9BACL|nr:hypothetical protein HMPREF9372_0379 [Sporosarcina newyorkensis 2681]